MDLIEWLWGIVGKEGNKEGFGHERKKLIKLERVLLQTNNIGLSILRSRNNSIFVCTPKAEGEKQ